VSVIGKFESTSKQSDGYILPLAMAIVVIMGIFVGIISSRFTTIIKNQSSIEQKKAVLDWGRAISERIDCERTLAPYNGTNRCTDDEARTLFFFDEDALVASGPENSYPIGKNWFAQVVCGQNDLRIKLAHFQNNQFPKDALTGRILNFSSPSSLVSDGGYDIPMCPSYFGSGKASSRILGMTIATHQKLLADYNLSPQGMTNVMMQTCDIKFGMAAQLDDNPLPTIFRSGGASAPASAGRSAYAEIVYKAWRPPLADWGQTGNLQPSWYFSTPRYNGLTSRAYCRQICQVHGMAAGVMTKCDNTASNSSPPLGQTVWDDTNPQVNCLCLQ
jgi:hypothetical protein